VNIIDIPPQWIFFLLFIQPQCFTKHSCYGDHVVDRACGTYSL